MKTLFYTLFLMSLTQLQMFAENIFRDVKVTSDSWELTFHEKGGRYGIEIDGVKRGTSGYLQRLVILSKESLRLIDKHFYRDIKPVTRNGKLGIEITTSYRDLITGEQKVQVTFEPNHTPVENK